MRNISHFFLFEVSPPSFLLSGVLVLTFFVNRFHVNTVTSKDQFIIAYGGLRGAICFSLVFLLPDFRRKKLFIAATTVVILFTVFAQVTALSPKDCHEQI